MSVSTECAAALPSFRYPSSIFVISVVDSCVDCHENSDPKNQASDLRFEKPDPKSSDPENPDPKN